MSSQGRKSIPVIENSDFLENRNGDCWSDLERSLTFDGIKYIDSLIYAFDRDLHPYNEEKSHSQIKAASELQENDPKDFAFQFTNDWFCQWLLKEYYGKEEDIKTKYNGVVKSITSCKDNKYITFNYTPTLENIFGVEERNILYIHNRFPYKPQLPFKYDDLVNDIFQSGIKKFQFGSINNNVDEWIGYLEKVKIKSKGNLIDLSRIEDSLECISRAFSKNLEDNYDKLKSFLANLKVNEIIIFGHSFMGVDEQYYYDILVPYYKDKKWIFYYYKNDSMAREFISKYSISEYEFIAV